MVPDVYQIRGTLDLADLGPLLLAGKILSGVALLAVFWILVDIWRRGALPAASYGEVRLSQRRMRWLWTSIILGATALGSAEDPIARFETNTEDAEVLAVEGPTRQSGLSLPFPFYRYERQRIYKDDALGSEQVLEGFLIPWALLSAFVAYLVLVVRWNPQSRLAQRILQGRRRRRERDADSD